VPPTTRPTGKEGKERGKKKKEKGKGGRREKLSPTSYPDFAFQRRKKREKEEKEREEGEGKKSLLLSTVPLPIPRFLLSSGSLLRPLQRGMGGGEKREEGEGGGEDLWFLLLH